MLKETINRTLAGDRRSLAKVISYIEAGGDLARECLSAFRLRASKSFVIGITGSPGVGKSTLVNKLSAGLAQKAEKVAILAVDPSSPFTGGALLGDRVRMSSLPEEVYMRSLASRGQTGGLAPNISEIITAVSAAGYKYILIETVGVGQAEVDIINVADSIVLLLSPGMGDMVQVLKAGIMEIADIYVVNKSDYPGVNSLVKELTINASLDTAANSKELEIFQTIATSGEGVDKLVSRLTELASRVEPI